MQSTVERLLDNYLSLPGKMIRPKLTQLFGHQWGLKKTEIDLIAQAAEKIHNASLIHDDVIDQAEIRRGRKTLNQLVSSSQAVLAGDYLLASVIADMAGRGQLAILKTLSKALSEIVEGEFLQDELKHSGASNHENLTEVAEKKTGALLAWCCSATAIVAGLQSEIVLKCEKIGRQLGVAFQMIDDNLDYTSTSQKDYAKDLKSGLINYTTLELINLFPERHYAVHQIRKTDFNIPPWTRPEMEQAKMSIQQKAMNIVNEVKQDVLSIAGRDSDEIISFINQMQRRIQ